MNNPWWRDKAERMGAAINDMSDTERESFVRWLLPRLRNTGRIKYTKERGDRSPLDWASCCFMALVNGVEPEHGPEYDLFMETHTMLVRDSEVG